MEYTLNPCSSDEADYIEEKLVEYNLAQVPARQTELFETFNRKMTDGNGNIIAGCLAGMYCWNVAYVDILWVAEPFRRQGLGSALLDEIERTAREKGCHLIHLDTFDFQAKGFYEKKGYSLFGTLEDCPQGHCRYYLKKNI